jgi:hypothetical protein
VTDGKNGRILLDRPKPTAACSASGRRRRGIRWAGIIARTKQMINA